MDSDGALEIVRRLDKLIALSAIAALQGKSQGEQIELLSRAGLLPKDIAQLIGTTPNTVSVTLSQLKRRAAPKAKPKK